MVVKPHARQELGTGQKIAPVHLVSAGEKVPHGELGQRQHGPAVDSGVGLELRQCALQHVQVDHGGGTEAPSLDEHGLLAEDLARLKYFFVRAEHGNPAQPELDQLQCHQPVVHTPELDTAESDEVDLYPVGAQPIEQALHELLRLVMLEESAMQEIDPDDAEGLLLQRRFHVEHAHVQDDLARFIVRMGLELDAHPAVAFVAAAEAPGYDGVGEGEEGRVVASPVPQPVDIQCVLVVQHGLEPCLRDVPVYLAVDRVADCHVVGGDRLGDGPCRRTDPEEPPGDLLPGADLGHRPVPARIQVDTQRLLMRVDRLLATQNVRHRPLRDGRRVDAHG